MLPSPKRLTLLLSLLSFCLPLFLTTSNASAYLRPDLGRWARRDPIRYVNGVNLYEYVGSTPMAARDPQGLEKYPGTAFPGEIANPRSLIASCCKAGYDILSKNHPDKQIYGFTMCCYGQVVLCAFAYDDESVPPGQGENYGAQLTKECTLVHENTHVTNGDVDCGDCIDASEVGPKAWTCEYKENTRDFIDAAECRAYAASLECLNNKALPACDARFPNDPTQRANCRKYVEDEIKRATQRKKESCHE